jgi:hypothetical protein
MHDDLDLKAGRGLSEWAVGAVGTGVIIATSIAHDGAGGALVTGGFSGEASFGSTSFQNRGHDDAFDVFVMHVTASGTIDWAVRAGGASFDISYGIAHDGAGGALVTGSFNGEATFGSTSFEASADYDVFGMLSSDMFVMHVTASGVIDWAVQAGGTDDDEGSGIACDGAGGALVTGYFSGTATFGNTSLASSSLLSSGHDPFVIHVSASGAIDWAVQAGSTRDARGTAIAYDGAGGALVSGLFSGEASFGSTSFESRGQYDVFVMHVTASGAIDWAVQAGGTSFDQSDGIAHDGAGGALVTGSFRAVASFGSTSLPCSSTENAFVMHVNASSQTMSHGATGAIDWAIQAGGTGYSRGVGIAHDGAGGALVTGQFSGEASFGSSSLTSKDTNAVVFHVTASGAIDWAIRVGDMEESRGLSIAHVGAGGALVTGSFTGNASFRSNITMHSAQDSCFAALLMPPPHPPSPPPPSPPSLPPPPHPPLRPPRPPGGPPGFEWTVSAGGTPASTAPDGASGAFVAGVFSGTQWFGSTLLESDNGYDTFVMHVTAMGAIDWAIQGEGDTSSDNLAYSIAHDGARGALVTGAFRGKVPFGPAVHTSDNGAYVMHVTASGVIDWVVQASTPATIAGGTTVIAGHGIANDGAGGALVTGYFEAGTFGSTSLDSRGNLDVFVMHVTASGAIDWAVQAGGTSSDEGMGIACDGAGGAFVTGTFSGKALFGSASLVSRGYQDVFVMHVTASGAIDWAVQAGGRTDEQGTGIAYDGAGGAFVTGSFSGEASFGNTSLKSLGDRDVFAMHVSASGAIDWAVRAGGSSEDTGNSIAHDGAGGALVTGWFNFGASFGSTSFESRGEYDGFLMHVSASGAIDWAVQLGGTLAAWGYGIAQGDEVGGFLVTGAFIGNVSLGSSTIASQPLQINSFTASLIPPPPTPPLPPLPPYQRSREPPEAPSQPQKSGFALPWSVEASVALSLAVLILFVLALSFG